MYDVVELGADGWLRGGNRWQPDQPFYAVLGDPIAHSLSPALQNAAMAARELDTEYVPIRIKAGQLRTLKEGDVGRWLAGFNVTAPLKEAVAALCDGRTDQARDIGAVNTVRVQEGRWLGHNTDSGGILAVLSQAWADAGPQTRGIVLGAGGSARAAVDALVRWELSSIEVRNRSGEGCRRMKDWLKKRELSEQVTVSTLKEASPADTQTPTVWINCVAGGVSVRPWLPDAASDAASLLLDLRYGDQLPEDQVPLGFAFSDGLPVLMMQGGLSHGWWFGPPIPWDAMREAVDPT